MTLKLQLMDHLAGRNHKKSKTAAFLKILEFFLGDMKIITFDIMAQNMF